MSSKSLETESFAMFTEVYSWCTCIEKICHKKIAAYWNIHKGGVWKNTGKYHGKGFTWKLQTPIVEMVSPKPHAESDIVVGKNWEVLMHKATYERFLAYFLKCFKRVSSCCLSKILSLRQQVDDMQGKNFWRQFSAKAPWLKRKAGHMENKTLSPIRL